MPQSSVLVFNLTNIIIKPLENLEQSKSLKFIIKEAFESNMEQAFQLITDPMVYPEIHPSITKVVKLEEKHFEFFETTSIFGIPFSFKYVVAVNDIKSNKVIMVSEVQKGVWIKLRFSKECFQDEQFLFEEIEVNGSYLIRRFLAHKLNKAHDIMFNNLKRKVYGCGKY